MGFASLRSFLACVVATVGLFLSAFILPDWIAAVPAIVAIILGLPISILAYKEYVQERHADPEYKPGFLRSAVLITPIVIFGAISILFGASIVLWVLYNTLIERQPEYSGPTYLMGFGIGPTLIAFGWYWLRQPTSNEKTAQD